MVPDRVLSPTARAFIAYDPPPDAQTARRAAPRDAYHDTRTFVERWAKLLGPETGESVQVSVFELPGHESQRLLEARRAAEARFGPLDLTPDASAPPPADFPDLWAWAVPRSRIDEVFEWLEDFIDCAVPGIGPGVGASVGCLFWLRGGIATGLLPGQRTTYRAPTYWHSQISLSFRAATRVWLKLMLPFEAPNEDARRYLRRLRPHLPVDLEPQHLVHFVPRADRAKYERRPVPPDFLD
jgi:hypothetical protein